MRQLYGSCGHHTQWAAASWLLSVPVRCDYVSLPTGFSPKLLWEEVVTGFDVKSLTFRVEFSDNLKPRVTLLPGILVTTGVTVIQPGILLYVDGEGLVFRIHVGPGRK